MPRIALKARLERWSGLLHTGPCTWFFAYEVGRRFSQCLTKEHILCLPASQALFLQHPVVQESTAPCYTTTSSHFRDGLHKLWQWTSNSVFSGTSNKLLVSSLMPVRSIVAR